ncbi:MAG: hypothetical protein M0006_16085 [Magnetospirillum sp.]|nr:hypothetical protein [Magnetospirillum sp.]
MGTAELLTPLYAASGLAASAFYLPQMRLLFASAKARRAMSPATWGGWLAVAAVNQLYVTVVAGDRAMIAVGAASLACQGVVFALALGQRIADRRLSRLTPRLGEETARTEGGARGAPVRDQNPVPAPRGP